MLVRYRHSLDRTRQPGAVNAHHGRGAVYPASIEPDRFRTNVLLVLTYCGSISYGVRVVVFSSGDFSTNDGICTFAVQRMATNRGQWY